MGQHSIEGKSDAEQQPEDGESPPLKVVLPAMVAISLSIFLVALDRTIIGTAIPTISAEFNSFGDIAWYEAGFLLPLCVFQLSFGLVYKYYSAKWVLVILVALFEVGSLVCALAPTSNALIVGRVITGIGGAGTSAGALTMINLLIPLRSRPKYAGSLGAMFGIASILGPILGGYLTSITWRWTFYINLPFGAVALVLLVFLTPNRSPPAARAQNWLAKLKELDPLGFLLVAPTVVCLLFAIQWGGTMYAWNNGTIIALFVVSGVLLLAFVAVQLWRKDKATIPPKVISQRSILVGCVANFGIGSVLVLYAFYLPIWFQVVRGQSVESSGLSLLPLLLSNVFAVISGGIATSRFGYYTPIMMAGGAILVVGSALITTWQVDVSKGTYIGYQILAGFGLGFVLQQPFVAAQTVLPESEISVGVSILNFITFLSGTVFVTVSQSLLQSKLVRGLQYIIPDLDPSMLTSAGAASIRQMVSDSQLPRVLQVYNDAMRSIWYLALGLSCLIFIFSFGMEWRSVKDKKQDDEDAGSEKA